MSATTWKCNCGVEVTGVVAARRHIVYHEDRGERIPGSPVKTDPKIEPLGPNTCAYGVINNSQTKFGWGSCSTPERVAVIWDGSGRGACGAHVNALTAGLEP